MRRAIAAGCVLASLAVVPLAAFLGVAVGTLSGSLGARLVAFALPGALLVLLVAAFFKIAISQRDVERRRIFPGAIATVALCVEEPRSFQDWRVSITRLPSGSFT